MSDNEQRSPDELALSNLSKPWSEDAKEFAWALVKIMHDLKVGQEGLSHNVKALQEMLGHSDAVRAKVEEIADESGDTQEDVLLKALRLYEVALEANRKGQRLVLVGPDYRFIREIVGLDRVDREPVESGDSAR
jgi:hypothetical protein